MYVYIGRSAKGIVVLKKWNNLIEVFIKLIFLLSHSRACNTNISNLSVLMSVESFFYINLV